MVHKTAVIRIIDHLKDLGSSRGFDVRGNCVPVSTDSLLDGHIEGSLNPEWLTR